MAGLQYATNLAFQFKAARSGCDRVRIGHDAGALDYDALTRQHPPAMRAQDLDTRHAADNVASRTTAAARPMPARLLKHRLRTAIDVACSGSGLLRWSE
ncbi:MAG: hypothetical protein ACNA7E_11170, partial [Wenzhouxiangellaceae bacterium]